jgi:6-phosphogluconolactonase
MAGTVSAFRYDAKAGSMQHLQTISSLPPGYKGAIESAEITAHPSGKFLYASNRGDANTVAVFAIDSSGMLKTIESAPAIGKTPRNFAIDPTGQFLLVAGQESNNVVVFRIDSKTGRLTATGQVVDVPMPVCLIFVPIN